jgi:sugar/nucleoside kinase (ribokinase family)
VARPTGTDRPRILVVGYNAFDMILPVAEMPLPDEKLEVPRMISCGGGPGATAAVALSRLGAAVRLMTPLTDDPPGLLQKQELLAAGVDISLSPVVQGHESPKAVILVDEARGYRTIFWSRGDVPRLPAALGDEDLLHDTDLLYLDGHEPEVSLRLGRAAAVRRLPVVLDAGSVHQGSRDLVSCCSDVVSSKGFAPRLTGCIAPTEALRALRKMGPARVGMTFGDEGVIGLENGEPLLVAAFEVPVTDTTGAGDAFHAGYAFARALDLDFRACLDWGCAVAAIKCSGWGGRSGLPRRVQVEQLLSNGSRAPLGPLRKRLQGSGV